MSYSENLDLHPVDINKIEKKRFFSKPYVTLPSIIMKIVWNIRKF